MIPALAEAVKNTSSAVADRHRGCETTAQNRFVRSWAVLTIGGEKTMKKDWMHRVYSCLLMLGCLLVLAAVPAQAAVVYSDTQIRAAMDRAFENGDPQVNLTINRTFAVSEYDAKREAENYAQELVSMLEQAALKNGRLMCGTSYTYTIAGDHGSVTYNFDISSQFTKKVTVVKSEKGAYKHALKALKRHDYKTSFYADSALYYETFVLALQHHPEYNYNLVIWKSTDGTFGYRAGNDLSAAQITGKIKQANAKANAIIRRIIKDGMTRRQKLRAIHNYLVKNCVYDENARRYGYDDAYTAYGCLVGKKAVCQGYAGAFNLLAAKAGICSIAVPGEAGGGSHAWNYVKNGGEYRYIDVTWDDPVPDQGAKAAVKQTYFYRTQAQLELTHTWDKVENAKKYVDYAAAL